MNRNDNEITLNANSFNTEVDGGDVVASAKATLIVDGKEVLSKTFIVDKNSTNSINNTGWKSVGKTSFSLPTSGKISIQFKAGWTVYFYGGGASVPVYHPIFWPFTININNTIRIK